VPFLERHEPLRRDREASEQAVPSIELENSTMNEQEAPALLTRAAEMAMRYASAASERRVAPAEAALAALQRFHEPFPESGCDPEEVLSMLDEIGSPATVATTGGRYFGFVNGATLPASLAANWLAGAWDQNAALPRSAISSAQPR